LKYTNKEKLKEVYVSDVRSRFRVLLTSFGIGKLILPEILTNRSRGNLSQIDEYIRRKTMNIELVQSGHGDT